MQGMKGSTAGLDPWIILVLLHDHPALPALRSNEYTIKRPRDLTARIFLESPGLTSGRKFNISELRSRLCATRKNAARHSLLREEARATIAQAPVDMEDDN